MPRFPDWTAPRLGPSCRKWGWIRACSRCGACGQLARLCPGNHESAGNRQSGQTRKSNRYLRRALVQTAPGPFHIKRTSIPSRPCFIGWPSVGGGRKRLWRSHPRSADRVSHPTGGMRVYRQLGADYYDRLHPKRTAQRSGGYRIWDWKLRGDPKQIEWRTPTRIPKRGRKFHPRAEGGPMPGGCHRNSSPVPTSGSRRCAKSGIDRVHAKYQSARPAQPASNTE